MKKTLVALAALAATAAYAQSTVTIYGTFDPSITSVSKSYANGTSATQTGVKQGQQGTEQVTFKGEEDLGGGMKALFLYELDFSSSAAGTPAAGEIYAGLSGGFGSIKLGTPNTPTLTVQSTRSPFGTKTGGRADVYQANATSALRTLYGTSQTRTAGSIVYASPSFSGFSAGVSYTPGASVDTVAPVTASGDVSDIGLFYANGPLSAAVAVYTKGSTSTLGAETQGSANVSYNFGPGAVTVGYHTHNNVGAIDSSYNIAASYGVAKNMDVLFNYVSQNDETVANRDQKMTALGLKYTMSKRTSLYARYVYQTTDNTTGTEIKDGKATIFGLQHNF